MAKPVLAMEYDHKEKGKFKSILYTKNITLVKLVTFSFGHNEAMPWNPWQSNICERWSSG